MSLEPICASLDGQGEVSSSQYRKLSRENTKEEKRSMKKARRKRKYRKKVEELKLDTERERKSKKQVEQKCLKYMGMSRTYWERWRWELHMRRDTMIESKCSRSAPTVKLVLPSINPSMLEDPIIDGKSVECFVGRGSFGIVRFQKYRGIDVAVKELLPRTLAEDVRNEAVILSLLCHPYLPCLFGICVTERPYRIIMQFHAIDGTNSMNLYQELRRKTLKQTIHHAWIFGAQIFEAVHYLHHEVGVLHNDITCSNILIAHDKDYHIILIDFGKASRLSKAKVYHLTETEKQEYFVKYPHLAPEIIYGTHRQSVYSDIYSIGLVLYMMIDFCSFSSAVKSKLTEFTGKCRSIDNFARPKSADALSFFETLMADHAPQTEVT